MARHLYSILSTRDISIPSPRLRRFNSSTTWGRSPRMNHSDRSSRWQHARIILYTYEIDCLVLIATMYDDGFIGLTFLFLQLGIRETCAIFVPLSVSLFYVVAQCSSKSPTKYLPFRNSRDASSEDRFPARIDLVNNDAVSGENLDILI